LTFSTFPWSTRSVEARSEEAKINNREFKNPPLGAALAIGAVTSSSVRIWFRTAALGEFKLVWGAANSAQTTGEWTISMASDESDFTGSLLVESGLKADTRYWLQLKNQHDQILDEGRFYTAVAEGKNARQFALAFMSCHQPFDKQGRIRHSSEQMLTAMHQVLEKHNVRQVIMAGDQMYSDMPGHLSLFNSDYFAQVAPPGCKSILDCSAQQVRQLFHRRYHHFWNIPGWRKLLANYACYPIVDDHDIVDNWGSAIEHGEEQWRNFRQGAFQAYCDYQASMVENAASVPPPNLDYLATFGNTATYFLDLRSNREVGDAPRIVSRNQLDQLAHFFADNSSRDVIFLVLSVPLIHLPKPLTRFAANITPEGEDFSDRWSTRGHRHDRDLVAEIIYNHQKKFPQQKVVLLSGDIHIGCVHKIVWDDRPPNLYQFISSGITHDTGKVIQLLSSLIIRTKRTFHVKTGPSARVKLLRGHADAANNPCGDMNMGIVEVTQGTPNEAAKMQFFLYSNREGEPVCKFKSEFI